MPVFDHEFAVHKRGILRALWRDICLIRVLIRIMFTWIWVGGRIRRRYAAKDAAGQTFWLDAPDR